MNFMKDLLNTRFLLTVHLVVVVVVIVVGAWSVHAAKNELRTGITNDIENQLKTVEDLAVVTDRNGADEVIAAIVSDCANRSKFESMLRKLASLNYQELLTVQQLFESCGSFYAERKAIMVSKLDREVEVLNEHITLLTTLEQDNDYNSVGTIWSELVELEHERSTFLSEQVTIQRNIIRQLIQGANILSKDISDQISRAQNVAEQLTVLDNRIDKLRAELIE